MTVRGQRNQRQRTSFGWILCSFCCYVFVFFGNFALQEYPEGGGLLKQLGLQVSLMKWENNRESLICARRITGFKKKEKKENETTPFSFVRHSLYQMCSFTNCCGYGWNRPADDVVQFITVCDSPTRILQCTRMCLGEITSRGRYRVPELYRQSRSQHFVQNAKIDKVQ